MEIKSPSCIPEIWGGIECTINRVGNTFRDQLDDTGYYEPNSYIDSFSSLGIKKMRFPILWEKHMPCTEGTIDWEHTAEWLADLRQNNIIPIAGLLHHGSGPLTTDLLDEAFPQKLAAYAGKVATRFPSLEYYTPVNEPLTTARFSGLYGFWYPHHQDERSFVKMLLLQVKGVILSMKAIRRINPAARLVQTEDLCKVHSGPALAYQARYENERRWLSYDLLCGKVTPLHPLWDHILSLGISQTALNFFIENSCPPDIMGFNYYVTSERFLDSGCINYPPKLHGGNGRDSYVDIDAARTEHRSGLIPLVKEAWGRYGIPVAITECHLNCSREEQMRWLKETWDACCLLNNQGITISALTAWSLLGSSDWDSLLLRKNGHYESGVFDISAGFLRPTILAKMIHAYAKGEEFNHPLLKGLGWWRQIPVQKHATTSMAPLLLVNNNSEAASYFEKACRQRGINYIKQTIHQLQHGDDQSCDGPGLNDQPWGAVFINDTVEADQFLFQSYAKQYAIQNNVPCMLFDFPADRCKGIFSHNENFEGLTIRVEQSDYMKSVHRALDLFIDKEKGQWSIIENKSRKEEIREAELIN